METEQMIFDSLITSIDNRINDFRNLLIEDYNKVNDKLSIEAQESIKQYISDNAGIIIN